jgi:hypothetical protein
VDERRKRLGFGPDGEPLRGLALLGALRELTDTLVVAFSRGKDSCALLCTLLDWNRKNPERAFRLVPYHAVLVPGLRFVEESLRMYEQFFGLRILRLPHPAFYDFLYYGHFMPPGYAGALVRMGLQSYSEDDLHRLIVLDQRLPEHTIVVTGVRAADSPQRMVALKSNGPISLRKQPRVAHPIWYFRKGDVIRTLAWHRCPLPVDYRWFGRTLDGIDYRFVKPLAVHAPDDYRRLVEWFPLVELEILRREWIGKEDVDGTTLPVINATLRAG